MGEKSFDVVALIADRVTGVANVSENSNNLLLVNIFE